MIQVPDDLSGCLDDNFSAGKNMSSNVGCFMRHKPERNGVPGMDQD